MKLIEDWLSKWSSAGKEKELGKKTEAFAISIQSPLADRKSAPIIGLVTSANKKDHKNRLPLKHKGIDLVPQDLIACPPAETKDDATGGELDLKGITETAAPESIKNLRLDN